MAAGALSSIVKNVNDSYQYNVIVIHDDISKYNQYLLNCINDKKNVSLKFIYFDVHAATANDINLRGGTLTKHTYTRLFLHKILPGLDRVLYLDGDILVNSDLVELFKTDLGECSIGACKSTGLDLDNISSLKQKVFNEKSAGGEFGNMYTYLTDYIGFKDEELTTYFNAGIILFNLKKSASKLDLAQDMLSKKYLWHDQDILNKLFKNDTLILDPKYNVYQKDVEEFFIKNSKMPDIIHFAGPNDKPNRIMTNIGFSDYWFTVSKTRFYYDALEDYIDKKLAKLQKDMAIQINHGRVSLNEDSTIETIYHNLKHIKKKKRKRRVIRLIIRCLVDSKRYNKLKKKPQIFFEDSKSKFIKFLGRYYN